MGEIMKKLGLKTLSFNVDEIAQYDISNHKIFGSAYFVYRDGVSFEKCYGRAALGSDTPVTNKSIFRLASMTKPITAVATLILVDKGLLALEERIDKYLPEFKNIKVIHSNGITTPNEMPTIKHILNHTSGIGGDVSKWADMTINDKKTLDNSIAYYVEKGLDFEPGTRQEYSPTGAFDVLTKIIEMVSGQDYLTFLNKELFEPCGMVDTTFIPSAEQQERMVAMHTQAGGDNAVCPMPLGCVFDNYPSTHYLGGAGLVSTLSDYAKFAKMLLDKGKTETARILKEDTFHLLCTPQVSQQIMPGNQRWGLGVRVITETDYPFLAVGSFGWSGAYGSHFWVDPKNKIFAVYMKNSTIDGGAANESAVRFEKAVYTALVGA